MSRHISKFLILLCLIWTLTIQNIFALSDDEKKKPESAQTKKGERVITTIEEEIIEDEVCHCMSGDRFPWMDPPLVKIMRTIYKPFKFAGKLFKSKN